MASTFSSGAVVSFTFFAASISRVVPGSWSTTTMPAAALSSRGREAPFSGELQRLGCLEADEVDPRGIDLDGKEIPLAGNPDELDPVDHVPDHGMGRVRGHVAPVDVGRARGRAPGAQGDGPLAPEPLFTLLDMGFGEALVPDMGARGPVNPEVSLRKGQVEVLQEVCDLYVDGFRGVPLRKGRDMGHDLHPVLQGKALVRGREGGGAVGPGDDPFDLLESGPLLSSGR